MRLMPFLPLLPAVPIVAVINFYGFIIVLAMLTPAWLRAMSASVLEIRRSWRFDRQQRDVAYGRLQIGPGLSIVMLVLVLLFVVDGRL
jgi:hypothetical protein